MAAVDAAHEPPEPLRDPSVPVEELLRNVWGRLNEKNEHFVGVIVGREGIGKSLTAIKLGWLLDPNFSADNVIFRVQTLLELLRDEDYQAGDVYILDEAGVSFGSRTWQDRAQRLANQALQLIRDHNIGLIFTLPRLGEFDSMTQGRLHAYFEITDKEPDEYVEGRWKWVDPDRGDTTGKVYKKYPRTDRGNRVTKFGFRPPPDEIIGPYNERKDEFQKETYDQAIEELSEDGPDDKTRSATDIADEILANEGVEPYINEINNGSQRVLDKNLIGAEYDLSHRKRKEVKSLLSTEVDGDVV